MNCSLSQQTLILSIRYIKDSMFSLVYTVGNKTDLVPIANAVDSPDCSGLTPVPQTAQASPLHPKLLRPHPCNKHLRLCHGHSTQSESKCPQRRQEEVNGLGNLEAVLSMSLRGPGALSPSCPVSTLPWDHLRLCPWESSHQVPPWSSL